MTRILVTLAFGAGGLAVWVGIDDASREVGAVDAPVARPKPTGPPTFVSPHAAPIAVHGGRVFVANTPADTVDVIDAASRRVVARVPVGVDPVGIAVRPDGKEVWVSNHVSDSVSVIDADPASPTHLHVVATVQEIDPESKATRFDEPVGIAFAGVGKAYVALSSGNAIAVVDVAGRRVVKRLTIPAQDPRALAVRGDRLYVVPFESGNRTQLSGGSAEDVDGELVTFDAWQHSIVHNNVLSLGHVVDVVKHPDVPDRDLFVFDTATDELVETVDGLGTLLYGLAVDSAGRVYVAQTDARNDVNGRAGTKKHGLAELENRAFLNRITRVEPANGGGSEAAVGFIDLEPLPPAQPEEGQALATPFAVQVTADDATLVASAAGSDVLFTVDAASGRVLGRTAVGAAPRGIALEESDGVASAWVLNAAGNTVSLVDLADPAAPKTLATVVLEDPTDPAVKRGRIAFESAASSRTGTFSCGSCHPDGHTDQLLWVLNTPVVSGGDQIMPRSTMPLRGLRDTEPFHWDGIPGDPYGGNNSANVHGSDPPTSDGADVLGSARHLIDGSLAGTMNLVGDAGANDGGLAGRLSEAERDDLAAFLLAIPFPPAPERAYDNVVSRRALDGFELFHILGNHEDKPQPNVCGDCHRMPFLVSTNTPGTGMDAPTWRGAQDRFLILPQGRLNIVGFDFYRRIAEEGIPERKMWQFSWRGNGRFDPVWDMVLQGSTGFSGAFARQTTLNAATAADPRTADLLDALEQAAAEAAVVLECDGVRTGDAAGTAVRLRFAAGRYVADTGASHSRDELFRRAGAGDFVGTFTARHPAGDPERPQPALWTLGPIERQSGRQRFPTLHGDRRRMTLSGRHVGPDAHVVVDGRRVPGAVTPGDGETVHVELAELPPLGMHLLQVQNPGGRFSNDFIFHVAAAEPQEPQEPEKPETLAAALRAGKFGRLLGTWIDRDTEGRVYRTTFSWKIPDRVIEQVSTDNGKRSVGLMSLNGKTGAVAHFAADAEGVTVLGKWTFDAGDAVQELGYVTGDGAEGTLSVRHHFDGRDARTTTVSLPGLPQPIVRHLIRADD